MGQVSPQVKNEFKLHCISHLPIHKSIAQIIPWLEQRQETAKRLYQFRDKLTQVEKENYESLIQHCERNITKILNFMDYE